MPDEDFSLGIEGENAALLRELLAMPREARKVRTPTAEVEVEIARGKDNLLRVFRQTKRGDVAVLDYYVMVSSERVNPLPGFYATQLAVWRGATTPPGLPGSVFWQIIFPRHGQAASDSSQTQGGRIFWRDRIAEALTKGLQCLVVDTKDGRSMPITSMEDFTLKSALAYGQTPEHARYRLVIRSSPR